MAHLFLHLEKFMSGQREYFQIDRVSHIVSKPSRQTSTTEQYKRWSHGITNVSITEVNMLKNSSTVAVCVPINVSIKLGFVSVNGPRETYFVDELRNMSISKFKKLSPIVF